MVAQAPANAVAGHSKSKREPTQTTVGTGSKRNTNACLVVASESTNTAVRMQQKRSLECARSMSEQNHHDYRHAAAQDNDKITIYDRQNGKAWVTSDTVMEIKQ